MDVDVDLVPDEPIVTQAQDTPSPGEVIDSTPEVQPDSNTLVLNKVHIRGLDDMRPDEVKSYVAEHFPNGSYERIEWIDDSSANLPFPSESIAQEALVALSSVEITDVTQLPVLELLHGKSFSKRPEVNFQVRFATVGDKKQAGAAHRSRFYLFNPEFDPENRKRRYRVRDADGYGRRRRGGSREEEEEVEKFDVNLYDDNPAALATRAPMSKPRPRHSYTSDYDSDERSRKPSHRTVNRSKELFPSHVGGQNGSRRDRSASPARDRNGDLDMDGGLSDGSAARNRRGARSTKDRISRSNRSKELFSANASADNGRLNGDEELSSIYTLQLADESADPPPRSKKLEDRITLPGKGRRLADRITDPAEASGFSIRGAARQKGPDQGFAIKGNADRSSVKELFPDSFGGNAGKELFADRLDGRSRRRQKAGDLFD
ncbi:uncharacterized protein BCR38DRAFT_454054 [Pseudomassariella vexata]|uniref:Uncharacterized protein n=1 Tax=Pseudomassariella vexata TaxID=1141098 RepID=A0A1Y2EJ14_9PEZI|nr:uncharacterized protein BCR38DRAFT_454054 [Pseudomassariella vexata]ORY71553.1 hypothetical protein BCR38DRAFT_454054 [Pseudomassariella vexata]